MNYSERRRYDPEIRAKVEEIHKARQAMLVKAAAQLKALSDEMRELSLAEDNAIYDRCSDAVWSAYYTVSRDAEFKKGIGGETYIGNLAAGSLGEYIERQVRK